MNAFEFKSPIIFGHFLYMLGAIISIYGSRKMTKPEPMLMEL